MNTKAKASFGYVFPSIRGVQARREFYVSMCPLRLIPKIFLFNEEELVPELRAQRILNKVRIPALAHYIVDNPKNYVFSALTASIDGEVRFEPLGQEGDAGQIGSLHVPMDAKFIINDGQHRRAAIEMAIRENPELADESIAVVFFMDIGLERCQQMFADLNRYSIRPSRSLGVLYDHRDDFAKVTKLIVLRSELFRNTVEMEKSTLSTRSAKLFTLSAIHTANAALLAHSNGDSVEELAQRGEAYWDELGKYVSEWSLVKKRKLTSAEVRRDYIHSHGITLHALGNVGNSLMREHADWKKRLAPLKNLDWSRNNEKLWEGRAMNGGTVSKAGQNVTLTTNAIKKHLKLTLAPEEQRIEEAYLRGTNGKN